MIPSGVEIFMAVGPIDLRWGFNRLSGVVSEQVGRDVRCGALFLFLGKRRDALKILFFDGTGLCLFYKRLDAGLFRLPKRDDINNVTAIAVDDEELNAFLDGIDIETPMRRVRQQQDKRARKPSANIH
jgi:transposase